MRRYRISPKPDPAPRPAEGEIVFVHLNHPAIEVAQLLAQLLDGMVLMTMPPYVEPPPPAKP